MADKQDFSFMKTGFNLVQENVDKRETMESIYFCGLTLEIMGCVNSTPLRIFFWGAF